MVIDLKSFLNKEEEQQISQILERAEKRLQRQYQQSDTMLYLDCRCRADEQIQENRGNLGSSCMADMQELLMMICQFCREHGCCQCREGEEREEGEELPF